MPLTQDEARRLDEIEARLRGSDRQLDHTLSGCSHGSPSVRAAAIGTGLIATPLLVVGVALQIPLLCLAGWLCIIGWVVLRCIDGW